LLAPALSRQNANTGAQVAAIATNCMSSDAKKTVVSCQWLFVSSYLSLRPLGFWLGHSDARQVSDLP